MDYKLKYEEKLFTENILKGEIERLEGIIVELEGKVKHLSGEPRKGARKR